MKDYIFIERKNQVPMWVYMITLLICLLIVGHMEKNDYTLRQQIKAEKDKNTALQGKSVHSWIMTDSCSDQLLNAKEGILRIKINK